MQKKNKFLYKKELMEGEWVKIIRSTTQISSKEMIKVLELFKNYKVKH